MSKKDKKVPKFTKSENEKLLQTIMKPVKNKSIEEQWSYLNSLKKLIVNKMTRLVVNKKNFDWSKVSSSHKRSRVEIKKGDE